MAAKVARTLEAGARCTPVVGFRGVSEYITGNTVAGEEPHLYGTYVLCLVELLCLRTMQRSGHIPLCRWMQPQWPTHRPCCR